MDVVCGSRKLLNGLPKCLRPLGIVEAPDERVQQLRLALGGERQVVLDRIRDLAQLGSSAVPELRAATAAA